MAIWRSKKTSQDQNANRSLLQAMSYGGLQNAAAQSQGYGLQQSAVQQQHQLYQQMLHQQMQNQYAAQASSRQPQFRPSKHYPNTMGWRAWVWDITANELRSPQQGTTWNGTELRCEAWDESAAVRGVAGIHAHLVPDDWHKLTMSEAPNGGMAYAERRGESIVACVAVQGLVERFGKFVLGTEGWRAEWVQIRKLSAPTDEIGLALERAFPDVEIVYGNR